MGEETSKEKRPLWDIVFWVIFIVLIILQAEREFKVQACYDGVNKTCGNSYAWSPEDGDAPEDLIRRLELGTEAITNSKQRRLAMLFAFGAALITFWFLKKEVWPRFLEFFILWVIFTALAWFLMRYYESHISVPIASRMNESLAELKYQLGICSKPENVPYENHVIYA